MEPEIQGGLRPAAKVFPDDATDLSAWHKGIPVSYTTEITLTGLPAGKYVWAVGLVDRTKGDAVGLRMAVKEKDLTPEGWARLKEVTIKP